jgi:hypothetical protein
MKIRLGPYGKRSVEVKPGYFVQKLGWYGEVWAEVLSVSEGMDDRFKSVTYADPRRDCGHDSVYEYLSGEHTKYYQIRDIVSPKALKKKKVRILYKKLDKPAHS